MALTGNTVQSTYLDLVQLEKSGAGLPSHAGTEAALNDGSGAQIIGRTAVRNWLDPHPDAAAFAETWEFSTKGTMTQGELETAGWTFANCTGLVANGMLLLTATSTAIVKAYFSTTLAGDFDIAITPAVDMTYAALRGANYVDHGGGVADSVTDLACYGRISNEAGIIKGFKALDGAFSTMAGTNAGGAISSAGYVRVSRVSGTVYATAAPDPHYTLFRNDETSHYLSGYYAVSSGSIATTFNRVFVTGSRTNFTSGAKFGIRSIRRFQ